MYVPFKGLSSSESDMLMLMKDRGLLIECITSGVWC